MDLLSFFKGVIEGVERTSYEEWLAFLLSICYVVLAVRKSILCWPFALISSGLYVHLCVNAQLYLEGSLQLFFVAMAVIGWYMWNSTGKQNLDISTWAVGKHFLNIVISGIIAMTLGWLFDNYTDQQNPYADAFTTIYSLTATYMVARKVLENWIYWIIIDIVSIWLYAQRGLNLTSLLFLIYTLIAMIGFVVWFKQLKLQRR